MNKSLTFKQPCVPVAHEQPILGISSLHRTARRTWAAQAAQIRGWSTRCARHVHSTGLRSRRQVQTRAALFRHVLCTSSGDSPLAQRGKLRVSASQTPAVENPRVTAPRGKARCESQKINLLFVGIVRRSLENWWHQPTFQRCGLRWSVISDHKSLALILLVGNRLTPHIFL